MPGIHKFGSLEYKFDNETPVIPQHHSGRFFNGGESDATSVMLENWKIKEGDIVVDIGAHIGSWTLSALAMGAEKVYCFEPNLAAIDILIKNLELNGWRDKVDIYQKALWHKKEERILFELGQSIVKHFTFEFESRRYGCRTEEEYPVECLPLDDFKIPKIDWMKMDTEGAEVAVLIGARETIERCKPKIIAEVHEDVIKAVIPDFKAEDIINWIPGYKATYDIQTISKQDNGASFLLYPKAVDYSGLKEEWAKNKDEN